MVQLPPTEFTWGKYDMLNLPFDVLNNYKSYIDWLSKQNIIGFCHSADCPIRPRPDCMSIMIEENNYQYWTHVPIDVWKTFKDKGIQ